MALKHSCRWVLTPNSIDENGNFIAGTYCEKKVKYHMVPDGGEPGAEMVREYDHFCPMHTEQMEHEDY